MISNFRVSLVTIISAVFLLTPVLRADDILVGGTYYYDVKGITFYDDKVWFKHRHGTMEVLWSDLSASAQFKYRKQHDASLKPAGSPSPSPTRGPRPAGDPAPANDTVVTIKGNGDKTSDPFVITSEDGFVVEYQSTSYLFVNVFRKGEEYRVEGATLNGAGKDHTFVNSGAGTYYIKITGGEGDYTVTVRIQKAGSQGQ